MKQVASYASPITRQQLLGIIYHVPTYDLSWWCVYVCVCVGMLTPRDDGCGYGLYMSSMLATYNSKLHNDEIPDGNWEWTTRGHLITERFYPYLSSISRGYVWPIVVFWRHPLKRHLWRKRTTRTGRSRANERTIGSRVWIGIRSGILESELDYSTFCHYRALCERANVRTNERTNNGGEEYIYVCDYPRWRKQNWLKL